MGIFLTLSGKRLIKKSKLRDMIYRVTAVQKAEEIFPNS